ncbi:MAG TPA: dCTP deaminase [Microbacteriaceae bacterium]|jgi:dCTP deaminase|nr:dCTP deaminase [Microbacteriaceae bacterium]
MTALVREDIEARLAHADDARRLTVTPLLDRERQIGPGSIDLRLGTEFLEVPRQNYSHIDPFRQETADAVLHAEDRRFFVALGDPFVLHPGQFVLGSTLEFLVLPNDLVGQVLSRSSWGRLGLLVATAVAVQPGFHGVLTLELVNAGAVPITLRPGLRVAQLQLWSSTEATTRGYGGSGKYNAPLGPQSNRLAWEEDERAVLQSISDAMLARVLPGSAPRPATDEES